MNASEVVDPTRDDPLLRGEANEGLGGPLGPHARPGWGWWSPLRVTLLALGVALLIGYLQKAPCRDSARWVEQFQLTHVCYTDTFASWGSYHLGVGEVPYFGYPVPYPPLIGALIALAAGLANVMPINDAVRAAAYFDVTAVLLSILAVITVITTFLLASRRRPWDALMVAIAPVLILHAFTNWDLLAVALLGLAMVAWKRGLPIWAGIALGLATAAKFWPLVLLLALLLLCWRAGRMREWGTMLVTTVCAWLAVSIPLLIFARDGFTAFWRTNLNRGPDWDSLWLLVQQSTGWSDPPLLNAVILMLCLAVAVGIGWLVMRAPRRPRVAQVAFVLLALFMLVGKVNSPHDALWLTPLAVLARPRWRMFLVWQATEVVLTVNRMLMLVGLQKADKGLPDGWWYATIVLRDAVLLALVAFVLHDMWRPERDVVRAGGEDDPAGGCLDGAPDRRPRPEPAAVEDQVPDGAGELESAAP